MWFSSLIPDSIAFARRAYQGTLLQDRVIGGAGLRDGLFLYGFSAFITLTFFYLFWKVGMHTLDLLGFNELRKEIEDL